jgi:hypothetical protein
LAARNASVRVGDLRNIQTSTAIISTFRRKIAEFDALLRKKRPENGSYFK